MTASGEPAPVPPPRAVQIAVCAPGDADPATLALADAVGFAIGARGCTLVCGGLGGAMRAACAGAKRAGGVTVAVLPGYDRTAANEHVDHVVCTGIGQARNAVVAASGDAVIAVGGGFGTLSEIALALRLGRPVVLVGGWSAALSTPEAAAAMAGLPGRLAVAEDAETAVREALRLAVG